MGKFGEYIEEVFYMMYERQQEEESPFISIDTLIDSRELVNSNEGKPRDCSSILSKEKYQTIENKSKRIDKFMTITGFIPGPNMFLSGLYGLAKLNEKTSPYVVIFTQRKAFLLEANEQLNLVSEKIESLMKKNRLTVKEANELHILRVESERLRNEIKVNKDYDLKELERINEEHLQFIGSKYIDDRLEKIPDV